VVKVNVKVGDTVSAGDILMVQESMKMELRVVAPCDGVVTVLNCAEGDMIERHSAVAEIEAAESQ
jgi:biotin carboxyl carrier protein